MGLDTMKCSYHEGYGIGLPPAHPFPMSKYLLLRNQLVAEGLLATGDILVPEPIDIETAALVHTRAYLGKLLNHRLFRLRNSGTSVCRGHKSFGGARVWRRAERCKRRAPRSRTGWPAISPEARTTRSLIMGRGFA